MFEAGSVKGDKKCCNITIIDDIMVEKEDETFFVNVHVYQIANDSDKFNESHWCSTTLTSSITPTSSIIPTSNADPNIPIETTVNEPILPTDTDVTRSTLPTDTDGNTETDVTSPTAPTETEPTAPTETDSNMPFGMNMTRPTDHSNKTVAPILSIPTEELPTTPPVHKSSKPVPVQFGGAMNNKGHVPVSIIDNDGTCICFLVSVFLENASISLPSL